MLGLGPNDAMNTAEKLYLGGFITYPRTETTFYNPNFDFHSLLTSISKSGNPLAEHADQLTQFGFSASKSGVDAGDHPPIMPTHKVPAKGYLTGHEAKLFDFVCRNFLASLSRDACFVKTIVIFEAAGHQFSLNGTVVVDPGFTEITPWVKISNKVIPKFEKGEEFPLSEIAVAEHQTTAPNYLSESELMSLMEKNGIGTDASMATHINNICQRNFVEVITRARRLKPTPLGNALIQGYKEIDAELISAELRSNIEKNMDLIGQGKNDIDSVLTTVLSIFKQKYEYFRQNIAKLEMTFVQVYGTFMDSLKKGTPFSYCGRCSQKMLLVEDFNKTYCKNCKITLNLPRDAKYSLESTQSCPLDGYQIINYYICRSRLLSERRIRDPPQVLSTVLSQESSSRDQPEAHLQSVSSRKLFRVSH